MDINKIILDIKQEEDLESYVKNLLEEARTLDRIQTRDRFFDLSLDMLCIAGLDGYFKKISRSFEWILGYSKEELLTRPFKDFVVDEDLESTDDAYDTLKEGDPVQHFENRYRCKDGEIKWIAWRCVVDPKEQLIYAIARDVTQQKKVELKKGQQLEELQQLLDEKNDGLKYARLIQNAMIPDKNNLSKAFPESFVYYAPKEIVSGDFFWMEQQGDFIFLAVADCTGHGVPGAMMTMICSSALNRVVREFKILETGKILDSTREIVTDAFKRSENEVNDGMDISLCRINKLTNEVQWSGANNPLLYAENAVFKELNADKMPVGRYELVGSFTTHTLNLKKGDALYFFTDGYSDQFGGDKIKKFMYRTFREKLAKISSLSMHGQKDRLVKTHEEWKGTLEQVDDILVVGIRL